MKYIDYIFVLLLLFSNNLIGQNCAVMDSLFDKHQKFFFGEIQKDSFISQNKSGISKSLILKAVNLIDLTDKNRFYIINDCEIDKKRNKMTMTIEEFRKDKRRGLDGYAYTNCPYFIKCINVANFKLEKGKKIVFLNWEF
jgi:hypothetical protein